MDSYDTVNAIQTISAFVEDVSLWYVRRSRQRVGPTVKDSGDKKACYQSLYDTLVLLTKMLAPIAPFIAEEIYRNLTGHASVHLSKWPEANLSQKNLSLEKDMAYARLLVEKIHAKRKELKIPVRQPLGECQMLNAKCQMSKELLTLIKDETNIKTIIFNKGDGEIQVELDTTITPELEKEGKVRDVIRTIQQLRKEKKCAIDEPITLTLPSALQTLGDSYLESIKRETLSDKILWGDSYTILTLK